MSIIKSPKVLIPFHAILAFGLIPIALWGQEIGASVMVWGAVIEGVFYFILVPIIIATSITTAIAWFGNSFIHYFPKVAMYVYWVAIPLTAFLLADIVNDLYSRVYA